MQYEWVFYSTVVIFRLLIDDQQTLSCDISQKELREIQ